MQLNGAIQSAHNHDPVLLYPTKVFKTFINTDRNIYKPGDKVKFRIFVIDEQFLPQNLKVCTDLVQSQFFIVKETDLVTYGRL